MAASSSPLILPPPSGLSSLLWLFHSQPGNSKPTCLQIPPVIGYSQLYLTNNFRSRNKVCTTKSCIHENLLVGPDLLVQNLVLQCTAAGQTSTINNKELILVFDAVSLIQLRLHQTHCVTEVDLELMILLTITPSARITDTQGTRRVKIGFELGIRVEASAST